jgi:hypothetical protein
MLRSHAALWESTGSLEMFVFQTLFAGNIGQFDAPGTVVEGLAEDEIDASWFAAGAADPDDAAGACAADAAGAAEQAAPAAVTTETAATAAAARTLLVTLRTEASWHGHSRHTRQPGEFAAPRPPATAAPGSCACSRR